MVMAVAVTSRVPALFFRPVITWCSILGSKCYVWPSLQKKFSSSLFSKQSVLGEDGKRPILGGLSRHRLSVRALHVTGPGAVDSPLILSMQSKIKEDLSADHVTVKDAYGDGRHVSIDVVSEMFEGKSAVNRQRLVYKAIWEELQGAVHAVDQLRTLTPAEAAKLSDL